jgi:hypothetical protein
MKSTYKQVKDLLDVVREYHKQLKQFYTSLSDKTDDKRVQMLLDYMSRYTSNLEEGFAKYTDEVEPKLLDTWIQYVPDPELLSLPDVNNLDINMTVDDVANIAIELDDRLVSFYSEAAERVDYDSLTDVFDRLKEHEQAEKSKITENAVRIKGGS